MQRRLNRRPRARATASPVRILFLDRDGTLNRSFGSRPPNAPHEVELLPGVAPVLSDYADRGWLIVIVTNQGGVASGYISEADAHAVQTRLVDLLPVPVAASYLCPHMAGGRVAEYAVDCPNRKPRPGFILASLERFGARAENCLFVGDSSTDHQAAEAAGVPFRWADLFFGRPIERGVLRPNGHWVQVNQPTSQEWAALEGRVSLWSEDLPAPGAAGRVENLALIARIGATPVGWLCLVRGESEPEANLTFGVDPSYRDADVEGLKGTGIGALLLECALDWARAQPGLRRLCVQVRADNLPVSRLCCRYGFDDRRSQATADGSIRLDCLL